MSPVARAVVDAIDERFDDHLATIVGLLRQRSVSADGGDMDAMASLLDGMLRDLGARSQVVRTPGFPVVLAELDEGAPRTLVMYGMYDTMPVEGETWMVDDPFAGTIVDLPGIGPSIVARGAENSKGALGAWLNMLATWRSVHGRLPVNLRFVIEGEEELGSPSLPAVVERFRDRLTGDAAVYPSLLQARTGKPVVRLGFKGIAFYELAVEGGDWGGPTRRAVHSSRAVWYHSPAVTLVQALATLISADQREVLIDGFYADVAGVPYEDRPVLAALAETFDPSIELHEDDAIRFKWDELDVRLLERYLYQPSLSIDGLAAGDMGSGAKTILPHEARAKLEFRFVPNQREEDLTMRLREHFRRAGFPQVEVRLHSTTKWSKTPVSSLAARAVIASCRAFGLEPEVWPTQAGSSPMYLFTDVLGVPFVPAGLGHGGGAHAPDEYATIDGLRLCEQSLAVFLEEVATAE
ncbi:MAG TPA: M20/M25/M40 family metallo-hydrolase [Candidatus Limnocylindrales bacterium]|nr:M20/M25/M40 family metallo-hydrolase [Candidatus Limnocylindrales bacterium]